MEKKRISAISTDLGDDAVVEISGELRKLLADVFALYVKGVGRSLGDQGNPGMFPSCHTTSG
jgi:hypothetical protein